MDKSVAPGVIYSDFDGVYNVPQRDGLHGVEVATIGSKFFRETTTIFWDRRVLAAVEDFIRKSRFELIWLTTWNEGSLIEGAARAMGFPHEIHAPASLNHLAKGKKEWTEWKARHIVADQAARPRPFIWIDDKAPLYWENFVREQTVAPSLILTTDSTSDLTLAELQAMENWLHTHTTS